MDINQLSSKGKPIQGSGVVMMCGQATIKQKTRALTCKSFSVWQRFSFPTFNGNPYH